MTQKHKTDHSKKSTAKLAEMAKLLRQIEDKTARDVKDRLGDNWRENLFEIIMTRVDLATPHKKKFLALRDEFRKDPKAIPSFARTYFGTMKRMLQLAEAPAHPHHIAAFSLLYGSIVDTFLKDDTRDHAKTMAALDKRLRYFEQFVDFSKCRAA